MNGNMRYEDVFNRLSGIMQDKFNIDIVGMNTDAFNKSLFGKRFRFMPRDLLSLFFFIEREFGIKIPQEEVAAGRFDTIHNICTIIVGQLESQKCLNRKCVNG